MRKKKNKTKKALIEHAIMAKQRRDGKIKNIIAYFLQFSKYHRPWLRELAERYKERGEYPMFPMAILPSYYEDRHDKEVSAFAALLLGENCDFDKIQAFRELMGKSPWKWFENREFVALSIGAMQNKKTGGAWNWKIAKVMNRLWEEVFTLSGQMFDDIGICDAIDRMARKHWCSRFDALTYLMEDCGVGNFFYKLRMLLMVMCTDDGFGLSLWHSDMRTDIKCPIALGMREFIKTWFPEWKKVGKMDDAIRLLGFDRECDFFYAWLGYKELQKRNPSGCRLYSTRYQTWYALDTKIKRNVWLKIQPELNF